MGETKAVVAETGTKDLGEAFRLLTSSDAGEGVAA
jgi:hypothetical protein